MQVGRSLPLPYFSEDKILWNFFQKRTINSKDFPIRSLIFGIWHEKNPRVETLGLCSFTGDERIELPLKVLETLVIPFDQSPNYLSLLWKKLLFYYSTLFLKSQLFLCEKINSMKIKRRLSPLKVLQWYLSNRKRG